MAANQGPVVTNTTPLINLVGVGLLDLLPRLYGIITIPGAVLDEYLAGKGTADPELDPLPWVQIVPVIIPDPALPPQLGAGEVATLSLGHFLKARAVLLDEAFGRKVARQMGLPVVGTLGILLAGKQSGFLAEVGPVIDEMIRQGRRISPLLRAHVLRAAGE